MIRCGDKGRTAIACGSLVKLKIIWQHQNVLQNQIWMSSKIRLMQSIVVSTALYGCESWTHNKESEWKIQAFEFKCLQRLLHVPYTAHQTNDSIWCEVTHILGPQEQFLATLKHHKMTWFGHINRSMGLANCIMQGMVDGRQGRGRPKISWLDNITTWTGMFKEEVHMMSKDRKRWREISFVASRVMPLCSTSK